MTKTDKLQRRLLEPSEWDSFVREHEYGHPFQLSGWGDLKKTVGWSSQQVGYFKDDELVSGAQMLLLPAPLTGRKLAYVPRGPVLAPDDSAREFVLKDLVAIARDSKAFYLKVEPSWRQADVSLERPWRISKETIIHEKTLITDLGLASVEEVTAQMSQKARRFARKAVKEGIEVRSLESRDELDVVYELYKETADRAGFGIHPRKYHEDCYDLFGENNNILLAYREDRPVAFLWGAHTDGVGIYLYGGSNEEGRKHYANYALQMELITDYYNRGVKYYDLNGAVTGGVTSFKSAFASEEVDWVGAMDYPINSSLYAVWSRANPALKPLARSVKRLLQS